MQGELIINAKDAYTEWGVSMGTGFLQALETPPPLKDYVKNTCRDADGSQYVVSTARKAERELTLAFYLSGSTEAQRQTRQTSFLAAVSAGQITLQAQPLPQTFKLLYTGKASQYTLNRSRTFAVLTLKFVEPNPTDRPAAQAAAEANLNAAALFALEQPPVFDDDFYFDETTEDETSEDETSDPM